LGRSAGFHGVSYGAAVSWALVAVPTLIAGLYGMNFQEMPGLRWVFGFPLTVGAMAIVDTWLYRRFRRAGWI
jgi:magnesium transporter